MMYQELKSCISVHIQKDELTPGYSTERCLGTECFPTMASMGFTNEQAEEENHKENNSDEQQNEGAGDERKSFKKFVSQCFRYGR